MENLDKPLKNHWTYIFSKLITIVRDMMFLIIICFVKFPWYYTFAVAMCIIVYAILNWTNIKFYIKENVLVIEEGILSRKKREIPLSKISTVDTTQTIIDRIFNTSTLKVDSGAVGAGDQEVKAVLNKNTAAALKEVLSQGKMEATDDSIEVEDNIDRKNVKKIKASSKDIILYALTRNKLAWFLGAYVFLSQLLDFVSDKYIDKFSEKASEMAGQVHQSFFTGKSIFFMIAIVLLGVILMYMIASILVIIIEIIRYNGFELSRDDKKVTVEYGLLTKKKYAFPIKKIQGIKLNQTILQQLFGIYTIEGIVIGYGDIEDKNSVIYPIANKKIKAEVIANIFGDIKFTGNIEKPKKKHVLRFIFKRTIIMSLIVFAVAYILASIPLVTRGIVGAILILSQIILGYINFKNTAIEINEDMLVMSSGSLKKVTHIIKQDSVQSIGKKETIFQRPAKLCTIIVDICTNTFGETVTVKNLDKDLIVKLEENLIL